MFYLFEIVNTVNWAIYQGDFESCVLLKYAVFSLSFIDKFNIKLDRSFCMDFALQYFSNPHNSKYMTAIFARQQEEGKDIFPKIRLPLDKDGGTNIYGEFLDSLFDTYMAENHCLVSETVNFNLLPLDGRTELEKVGIWNSNITLY